MTKRCTFAEGLEKKYHCGSFAFNLAREGIQQGNYCDKHYWQNLAEKKDVAEAAAAVQQFRSSHHGEFAHH